MIWKQDYCGRPLHINRVNLNGCMVMTCRDELAKANKQLILLYVSQLVRADENASYCLEESKRCPGKTEPPIETVRINALLCAGELDARAMMLARKVDRPRDQFLTKTKAAMMR